MSKSRIVVPSAPIMQFEAFVYRPVQPAGMPLPATGGNASASVASKAGVPLVWSVSHDSTAKKYTEEEVQASLGAREKQAREKGFEEAQAKFRSECENALAAERSKVAAALEEFANQRKTYFEQVEPEVVRLALSIARKILHREAQIDPLLLSGIVRVALEKISTSGVVRLRVPEKEVTRWQQIVTTLENVGSAPEVVGDNALAAGRCVLETEVGTTNLSLDAQLEEIEHGLLDLMALRPGA